MCTEIDLVIYGHNEAKTKCASTAGQGGSVELPIEGPYHACGRGEVDKASEPFACTVICLRRGGSGERTRGWRRKRLELLGLQVSACEFSGSLVRVRGSRQSRIT